MNSDKLTADLETIRSAQARGRLATLGAYARLSGPGWLQSAVTLGGGTLASSLYLGVLAGQSMLWLQPFAMVLGIVMLCAISHVTLSTGERPFDVIRRRINPALAYGWALASLAASMVWSMPQFTLATGVLRQNLLPGLFGPDGPLGDTASKLILTALVLVASVLVTLSYDRGARGVRIYERSVKFLVALVVVCFFGVVLRLSVAEHGLDWGAVLGGFVPDFEQFAAPAATFEPFLARIDDGARAWWSERIVAQQRDVLISAAATAVGINMTFLLPYSMLQRGWTREFRGLAKLDLGVGMLIPYVLATSCIVIAAADRFHTRPVEGLVAASSQPPSATAVHHFESICDDRLRSALGEQAFASLPDIEVAVERAALPAAERELAAMLVHRDAFDLATALAPFTGDLFANVLFGIGVLGMALSTITLLMLICGFVICELRGLPPSGPAYRLATLAGAAGALGPFIWSQAAFYLAVPTSVFGMALLPIAYWTFFWMMNSRAVLGDDRPRGGARIAWNLSMLTAASLASAASLWGIHSSTGGPGIAAVGAFLLLVAAVQLVRRRR